MLADVRCAITVRGSSIGSGVSCSHAPHGWYHIAIQVDDLSSAGECIPMLSLASLPLLLAASGNGPFERLSLIWTVLCLAA